MNRNHLRELAKRSNGQPIIVQPESILELLDHEAKLTLALEMALNQFGGDTEARREIDKVLGPKVKP